MKKYACSSFLAGFLSLALFGIFTAGLCFIDVQPVGIGSTNIGFSTFNSWFYGFTGVHMVLYSLTDIMSLIPIFTAMLFAVIGAIQIVKRRSILRVDHDILLLGVYYILVIICYLAFEGAPVNFRPILIDGKMEASYPSSTTLLVLTVMAAAVFEIERRVKAVRLRKWLFGIARVYTVFMVIARLLSGVHWLTDIIGAILLGTGLFYLFRAAVILFSRE